MTDLYRIKSAEIMHETIDGEVVIIHLDRGIYYSSDGAGALLWGQLEQGSSLDALAAWAGQLFTGAPAEIRPAIEAFVSQLLEEGLIDLTASEDAPPPVAGAVPAGGIPWTDPVLQKYTDMEQLLLLDPIHEVEDTGWPNVN